MKAVALGRRAFPADQRILDLFLSNGFVVHRDDEELVVGGIERISRRQPVVPLGADAAARFRDFAEPAHLKLAFNFRYREGVLSTETRVFGTDKRAPPAVRRLLVRHSGRQRSDPAGLVAWRAPSRAAPRRGSAG
jgi:hypothetical protein